MQRALVQLFVSKHLPQPVDAGRRRPPSRQVQRSRGSVGSNCEVFPAANRHQHKEQVPRPLKANKEETAKEQQDFELTQHFPRNSKPAVE